MKLKKGIPVIDQGNKLGFWGGKFGGNFVPETLKKPIEDLEVLFNKLKKDKKFIQERDKYFKNWIGSPTRFIKLNNLTDKETDIEFEKGKLTISIDEKNSIHMNGPVSKIDTINVKL